MRWNPLAIRRKARCWARCQRRRAANCCNKPRGEPRVKAEEPIEGVRKLLRKVDANPKMRRAVGAAIKAMGLPAPLPAPKERGAKVPQPERPSQSRNG